MLDERVAVAAFRAETKGADMKTEIHPEYVVAHVRCTCGNEFETRSTKPEIKVEICSNCHPFYTGKQKLVDSGGRVERFQRKLAAASARAPRTPAGPAAAASDEMSDAARRPLVEQIMRTRDELSEALADPGLPSDRARYAEVNKRWSDLAEAFALAERWRDAEGRVRRGGAGLLAEEDDADVRALLEEARARARRPRPAASARR